MRNVGSVVSEMLRRGGLRRSVCLAEIWTSWEKIAGPDVASHTRPIKVVGRKLYVEADSSPIHHKLSFMKEEILNRVRAFTGGAYIEDILFQSHPRGDDRSRRP